MATRARHPGGKPALDEVSKAIVEQLQADGRRSYAEIGKAVGLSEPATRQRVQKLIDSGVMQIVAVTDPMQLGFYRQAMVGIRAIGDTRAIADKLCRDPRRSTMWCSPPAPSTSSSRSSARMTTNCSVCSTRASGSRRCHRHRNVRLPQTAQAVLQLGNAVELAPLAWAHDGRSFRGYGRRRAAPAAERTGTRRRRYDHPQPAGSRPGNTRPGARAFRGGGTPRALPHSRRQPAADRPGCAGVHRQAADSAAHSPGSATASGEGVLPEQRGLRHAHRGDATGVVGDRDGSQIHQRNSGARARSRTAKTPPG